MRIRSYPRIHTVLLDLGNVTNRKYGGAGFILDGPTLEVEIELSNENIIIGVEKSEDREKDDILKVLKKLEKFSENNYRIEIHKSPPRHVGLGSKTSLLLNIIKGVQSLSNISLTNEEIVGISGRGGTSGIGVNGFFSGGFIVDCGQAINNHTGFIPSSVDRKRNHPPVVYRGEISSQWKFLLFLPEGKRFEGKSEIDFFTRNTPLEEIEVLRNLGSVYHGLVPSVMLQDLKMLKKALEEIHEIGFTYRILSEQSEPLKTFYQQLRKDTDCAIGISSMGPLIYAIINKNDVESENKILKTAEICSCDYVGSYFGKNSMFDMI